MYDIQLWFNVNPSGHHMVQVEDLLDYFYLQG